MYSYDQAVLSVGPIQQTAGSYGSRGELQGALARVPDAVWNRHFGDLQLAVEKRPMEPKTEAATRHFELAGRSIAAYADKNVLREFVFAYRFVKAMRDVEFRVPFLGYGLTIRPDVIRSLRWPSAVPGRTVAAGDVFKTEVALALLLDTHVNLPSILDGKWTDSAAARAKHPDKDKRSVLKHDRPLWLEAALAVVSPPAGKTLAEITITNQQELAMVGKIVELRRYSAITDPDLRSAKVLMSLEVLTDATAGVLGFDDVAAIERASGYCGRRTVVRYRACRVTGAALASNAPPCHPQCN